MVERFHCQLKASLRARLINQQWMIRLPWVLLGVRAASKEECGLSSAEMVYGVPLTLPREFLGAEVSPSPGFPTELRGRMSGFQPPEVPRLSPAASLGLPPSLLQAELVYIQREGTINPLSPFYDGPYRFLEKREKYFQVDIRGRAAAVSGDRLKPYLGPSGVIHAVPAKRGCPPGARQLRAAVQPERSAQVGGQGRPPEVAVGSRS
jgi:hypothetical protein